MTAQKTSISPYLDYDKSADIHGTALYPAVMVAPVQHDILTEYMDESAAVTIFDPFVGSGTSLYEAMRINGRANLIGSDINPLAILITRVKLEGVNKSTISEDIERVRSSLLLEQAIVQNLQFHNIEKWFKPEIVHSLSCVHEAVRTIEDERNRRFFWYMMIDIVRKYCNSRSSTYKLHKRIQEQIDHIEDGVIDDYLRKIEHEHAFFKWRCASEPTLNQGDSLQFMRSLDDDSVDICISSPPYGDNATTVPYGQYSNLAMSWIDSADLELSGWELENYAAIDSRSLGGWRHEASNDPKIEIVDAVINGQIGEISKGKRTKVERFMSGYQLMLDEALRVTKGPIILTLGNRTVDGINIDLTGYTKRYLQGKGRIVEERMRRTIKNKRTPSNVSRVCGHPVSSMKEEFVIVARPSNR